MPVVWANDNIWVAKNEIFYTTANCSQMEYMGSYWLNDDDLKEFHSMLPNFQ